jgi:hypothetical protein
MLVPAYPTEISRLPWCEAKLHAETATISPQLVRLNSKGFLTINSQVHTSSPSPSRTESCGMCEPTRSVVYGHGFSNSVFQLYTILCCSDVIAFAASSQRRSL